MAENSRADKDAKEMPGQILVKPCTLWVHSDSFSKQDVLFNASILPDGTFQDGMLLEITHLSATVGVRDFQESAVEAHAANRRDTRNAASTSAATPLSLTQDVEDDDQSPDEPPQGHGSKQKNGFVFIAHDLDSEQKEKHTNLQISISEEIAQLFGFQNRSIVNLAKADDSVCASHVEIAFRDVYLARGDMWRLASDELSGRALYRGQRLQFLGTIKAVVKGLYANDRKVPSALFSAKTRPIFRSESAKYVIYIQMSKEMWDFDESTGDIMFDKVINGFLPDLFQRWARMKVRHVVSIVLFTRMEYKDRSHLPSLQSDGTVLDHRSVPTFTKDFYRVVVSEMASGDWQKILYMLKREFRVFLRDVSTQPVYAQFDTSQHSKSSLGQGQEINGHPSGASKGNILEAINLAASQFCRDYVDRDLARTGISVMVITPGTGVFEVTKEMLNLTTEVLIDNGIGIDVVSLSPVPLHAVPLFKYKPTVKLTAGNEADGAGTVVSLTPRQEYLDVKGSALDFRSSPSSKVSQSPATPIWRTVSGSSIQDGWLYAVPHWIDISFWTSKEVSRRRRKQLDRSHGGQQVQSQFSIRCRLYELQMMGFLENEASSIMIPYMHETDTGKLKRPSKSQGISDSAGDTARFAEVIGTSNTPRKVGVKNVTRSKDDSRQKRREQSTWMEQYDASLFKMNPVSHSHADEADRGQCPRYDQHSHSIESSSTLRSRKERSRANSNGSRTMKPPIPPKLNVSQGGSSNQLRQNMTKRSALDFLSGQYQKKATPSAASVSLDPFSPNFTAQPESTEQQLSVNGLVSSRFRESLSRTSSTSNDQTHSQPISIQKQQTISSESSKPGEESSTVLSQKPGYRIVSDVLSHSPSFRQSSPRAIERYLPEDDVNEYRLNEDSNPWLTLLNPSGPLSYSGQQHMQYHRWQHVAPKAQHGVTMKWKSLCSPAALPLTNGSALSTEDLRSKYSESPYRIALNEDEAAFEAPKTRRDLIRELISFRLSHGFQIVVVDGASNISKGKYPKHLDIFSESFMSEDGATLYMSKGSHIHQMTCAETGDVQVTKYTQNVRYNSDNNELSIEYRPLVRTLLGRDYEPRHLSLSVHSDGYNWNYIDNYIAGYQHGLSETLRFWRARFVLIPVEPPPSGRRTLPLLSEDSDEEVRLEGLHKLSQMWQKYRYMSPEQRRIQSQKAVRKDPNPLKIEYQTRNPSLVVAAGVDNTVLAEGEATHPITEVVTDAELYSTTSFDLHKLSQHLQGENGIKIQNRRWHWKLHLNSFVGSDLATWLLANFRDVETRDEAVDLGNSLMEQGLFQHVSKKHIFRDGNFFYNVGTEYRSGRPESRSWFGTGRRQDKSYPSTPMSDASRGPSTPDRTRTETERILSEPEVLSPSQSHPTRAKANLSGVIPYEIDHRRKSSRSEVISLHYDRLHNPENAFHIQLAWGTATGGLIEDILGSWTLTAEKHGLRLVQIPLNEASSISDYDPFRAPYPVKLAVPPPDLQHQHYFEHAPAGNAGHADSQAAHRAILKKFQFVLDYEAASNFPADVEVSYSWGKANYRFSQYVHKTGTMLAQITTDGTFLLLANRLCNNRFGASRDISKSDRGEELDRRTPTMLHARPNGGARTSPIASPMVRPLQDVPQGIFESTSPEQGRMKQAEQLKDELESFCHDEKALKTFYDELNKATVTPSGKITPALEATIPRLGLPPRIDSTDRLTPL